MTVSRATVTTVHGEWVCGLVALTLLLGAAAPAAAQTLIPMPAHYPGTIPAPYEATFLVTTTSWSAVAMTFYDPTPVDYDLELQTSLTGPILADSSEFDRAELVVFDGMNPASPGGYYVTTRYRMGIGLEVAERSDASLTLPMMSGMNVRTIPSYSCVRLYHTYLTAGTYTFTTTLGGFLAQGAEIFVFRPTTGTTSYCDDRDGSNGHRLLQARLTMTPTPHVVQAPVDGMYAVVALLKHEHTAPVTFSVEIDRHGGSPDTSPPTVAVMAPVGPNPIVETATVVVNGMATDDVGVTAVEWSNETTQEVGQASGTTFWTTGPIPLKLGDNELRVLAYDAAGNVGTATLWVTRRLPTNDGDNSGGSAPSALPTTSSGCFAGPPPAGSAPAWPLALLAGLFALAAARRLDSGCQPVVAPNEVQHLVGQASVPAPN